MKQTFTRILSFLLTASLMLGLLPFSAMAETALELPPAPLPEGLAESGLFYLSATEAELPEDSAGAYLLRVRRGGESLPAASLRLQFMDFTAKYGEDYTANLRDAGPLESRTEVPENSTSVLEAFSADPSEITELVPEEELTEEEMSAAYEEDAAALESTLSEELSAYAAEHPDSVEIHETDTEASKGDTETEKRNAPKQTESAAVLSDSRSALSAAFEADTGLTDDWVAESSDGSATLNVENLLTAYSMDTMDELMREMDSAFLPLEFAEGETEKLVELRTRNNSAVQGDRYFIANLVPASEEYGGLISGVNALKVTILDDEDWSYPTVDFDRDSYVPEDGYLNVRLVRSGVSTVLSTVTLRTEDLTAVSGRDYSQVEAEVVFPYGMMERTVRIPVRGEYLTADAAFALRISDPVDAVIGEGSYAVGELPAGAPEVRTEQTAMVYGLAAANSNALRYGPDLDLSKASNPYAHDSGYARMENGKYVLHANSKSPIRAQVWAGANWSKMDNHWDWSGFSISWSKSGCNNSRTEIKMVSRNAKENRKLDWKKVKTEKGNWGSRDDAYYCSEPYLGGISVHNSQEDGFWRSASHLEISKIRPILRAFTVKVNNDNTLQFYDKDGARKNYDQVPGCADAGKLWIADGGNLVTSATRYSGDTAVIRCNPKFAYIKSVKLKDGTIIASGFRAGTDSVSIKLDAQFFKNYGEKLSYDTSDNGKKNGLPGTIELKVELGYLDTEVKINTSTYGTVTKDFPSDTLHIGDNVKFSQTVGNAFTSTYSASRIGFLRTPTNNDPPTDERIAYNDGSSVIFQNTWKKLEVNPCFDPKENNITVRVKTEDVAKFDTTKGLFANRTPETRDGYQYYVITSTVLTNQYYDLQAIPRSANDTPRWTLASDNQKTYSQRTFYHKASEKANENLIYLSCGEGSSVTVSGTTRYADVSMSSKSEGEAFLFAPGVLIVAGGFATMSDEKGTFKTLAARGVVGDWVVVRMTALGRTLYKTVKLSGADTSMGNITVPSTGDGIPYAATAGVKYEGNPTGSAVMGPGGKSKENIITVTVNNDNAQYTKQNQTAVEKVKRVEVLAVEPKTRTVRNVITKITKALSTPTGSQTGTSVWQTSLHLRDDEPNVYQAGDRIYVRVVTDRPMDETDSREMFRETAYPMQYTGVVISSMATEPPEILDINLFGLMPGGGVGSSAAASSFLLADGTADITKMGIGFDKLPVIGSLVAAFGTGPFTFSVVPLEGVGQRLCVGIDPKMKTAKKGDDDKSYGMTDIRKAFEGMKQFGKDIASAPGQSLNLVGFKGASVDFYLGFYMDFVTVKKVQDGRSVTSYNLRGGGVTLGANGKYRLVIYFSIMGVPFYFGSEGNLALYAQVGGTSSPGNPATREQFLREGMAKCIADWDFSINAMGNASAFVGAGLCGVLGARGGVEFTAHFIWYPTTKIPNVSPFGLRISLKLAIWVDALIFSSKIPVKELVNVPFGYFKDAAEYGKKNQPKRESALASDNNAENGYMVDIISDLGTASKWKPTAARSPEASDTVLQQGGFPHADPQLLDLGNGNALLVFIGSDSGRPTLRYSVYHNGTGWDPSAYSLEGKIDGSDFAAKDDMDDFHPSVTLARGNVWIAWTSATHEMETAKPDTNDYDSYLRSYEIYAARADVADLTDNGKAFFQVYRMTGKPDGTSDSYYDYNPQIVGDEDGNVLLVYEKADVKLSAQSTPDDSVPDDMEKLMRSLSPAYNGSYLVYQRYKNDSWIGSESTAPNGILRGRERFVNDSIPRPRIDRPNVIDFCVETYRGKAVFAYTVDGNSDISSTAGRNLYLKVYDFEQDNVGDAIRVTNDTIAQTRPFFAGNGNDVGYLFWNESDKNIAYLDLDYLYYAGFVGELTDREKSKRDSIPQSERDITPQAFTSYVFGGVTSDDADPGFGSYYPYVDSMGKLYIIWLQPMADTKQMVKDESAETETLVLPTTYQEIYLSAYNSKEGDTNESTSAGGSWSDPVRITTSKRYNDEPAVAILKKDDTETMLTVCNQYDMTLGQNPITNLALVTDSRPAVGTLEVENVEYSDEMPMANESTEVIVTIANTGVKPVQGYTLNLYQVTDKTSESLIDTVNGTETIYPGGSEEKVVNWTMPNSLDAVNSLSVRAVVSWDNGSKTNDYTDDEGLYLGPCFELDDMDVYQDGDAFTLEWTLTNVGNKSGAAQIECGYTDLYMEQDGDLPVFLKKTAESLAPGACIADSATLENIDPKFFDYGYTTLYLAADEDLSTADVADSFETLYAIVEKPLEITVNGVGDSVALDVGQRRALRGSYSPTNYFRDGTVTFTTDDPGIARVENGVLVGVSRGVTTLRAMVEPYGGEKAITVIVSGEPSTPVTPVTPGSDSGESGAVTIIKGGNGIVAVPVSGGSGSVSVSVTINGDTSALTKLTAGQLAQITQAAAETGSVSIDLSSLPRTVTAVNIPAETAQTISEALNEADKSAALTIVLPQGSLAFDAEALAAVVEQAAGADMRLELKMIGTNGLTEPQQAAVRDMEVLAVYDADILAGGRSIHAFNGGSAEVAVDCELAAGQYPEGLSVCYLAEGGTKTEVPSEYLDGTVVFTAEHFSEYAITYDAQRAAETVFAGFDDLDPGDWYRDGVLYALEKGIMNGTGGGRFEPNTPTSRAMTVTMLWRARGEPVTNYAMTFGDVPADRWYTEAVRWAAAEGIVGGYSGEAFGPDDNVTREQLAAILYRYAGYSGMDTAAGPVALDYTDAHTVSAWAVDALRWTVMKGIINGMGDNTLSPGANATRAQVATMLMRFQALSDK